MREFRVNLSVDKSNFIKLYEQLSKSYQTGVALVGNSISLDNETAKGKIEFFSITPHISLLRLNVLFGEEIGIRRIAVRKPSFYSCLFSLKENIDLHAFDNVDEELNRIGLAAKHSAIFFSADVQTLFKVIPNETSKAVIIIFSKNALTGMWDKNDDEQFNVFNGDTVKGYAAMTSVMIDEVNKLFEYAWKEGAQKLFFLASVYNLLASLIQEIHVESNKLQEETGILEASRMIQIRNVLVSDLSGNCPSIEDMAHKVHMSLTKFKVLFKRMFKLSYYQYYQHYRLHAAKESLTIGKSPTETAYEFGFANLAHFSYTFKKKFKISPTEI
ncbi:helix-turn-helix domain-containing protein [Pinibacter soli]|uniref:AraC family transcriptional regulator n=1 Tax=Pinibacter soli TaxID=3044211 RepID=A0ABT6R705_9BACT|nr:AraC family transcriptional regulator [Pinibacter soli]MDI3318335.1 AraC family transcriptional regulator [Pinibacter soli]